MKTKSCLLPTAIFTIISCVLCVAQDDVRNKYVGQSNCLSELANADHYGMRLDKSQTAYLDAYQWKGKNILAIVQYKHEGDKCGTIRDVVQSRDTTSSFIFECTNSNLPSEVVVGTWPETHRGSSGTPVEAWKIDLRNLKFGAVKGPGPVRCVNRDYSGSDEGDDLATWARTRSAKSSLKPRR